MKKRVLSFLLTVVMLLSLCPVFSFASTGEDMLTDSAADVASALDGKKVLFVGCSFTFYGGTVAPYGGGNYQDVSVAERDNDLGLFYQLCKANGAEVDVTDWTFGGHNLSQILDKTSCGGKCGGNSNNHSEDLTDTLLAEKQYDYVILNEIWQSGYPEEICANITRYMQRFRDANPNTKFYYILHDGVYINGYPDAWLESVELIKNAEDEDGQPFNATLLDWGTLVLDVANGDVTVPGATQNYNVNTFMVCKNGDRHHPNILTGYLYALMTYCAITGETAVGQPYDFCYKSFNESGVATGYPILNENSKYSDMFEIQKFISSNYTLQDDPNTEDIDESDTNFDEVLNSPVDMAGLQQLVDRYLSNGNDDNAENNEWEKYIEERTADTKKVLFVGETMMYYGGMVIPTNQYNTKYQYVRDRRNNKGLFYELCTANNMGVTVTDWVVSNHSLYELLNDANGICSSSRHSSEYTTNHYTDFAEGGFNYDYVVFQQKNVTTTDAQEKLIDTLQDIMTSVKAVNASAKFYYMINYNVYRGYQATAYPAEWRELVTTIENMGVTIIDTGTMIYDILNGNVTVPDTQTAFSTNTFAIAKDINGNTDGYHSNILTAYLDSLALYCAITGQSAVGAPYDFTADFSGNLFGSDYAIKTLDEYEAKFYENDADTNFDDVLSSPSAMKGLQELVDAYRVKKGWVANFESDYYTVTLDLNADGAVCPISKVYAVADATLTNTNGKMAGLPVPIRTGYQFDGWYTTATGGEQVTKDTLISADITIYAKWTSAEQTVHTIIWKDEDGTVLKTEQVNYGAMPNYGNDETMPTKASTSVEKYAFSGWTPEIAAVTADVTYTATYTATPKNVLFVGESMMYYGGMLIPSDSNNSSVQSIANRRNDKGLFYELCRENDWEVPVTDWTFTSHSLYKLLNADAGNCSSAHSTYTTNHYADFAAGGFDYDYVVFQQSNVTNEANQINLIDTLSGVIDAIRDVNPEAKFYYMVHYNVYDWPYGTYWRETVKTIENMGVTILDTGTLVYDIVNSDEDVDNISVPGATLSYDETTFTVAKKVAGDADGYHPNILTSYLDSLMLYCAITGESAVGKTYDFCGTFEENLFGIAGLNNMAAYKTKFYGSTSTNFDLVMESEPDMRGLQKLVDEYLVKKGWVKHFESNNYCTVTLNSNGGECTTNTMYAVVDEGLTNTNGKVAALPVPTRTGYTFAGWYTAINDGIEVTTSTQFSEDTTIYAQWIL